MSVQMHWLTEESVGETMQWVILGSLKVLPTAITFWDSMSVWQMQKEFSEASSWNPVAARKWPQETVPEGMAGEGAMQWDGGGVGRGLKAQHWVVTLSPKRSESGVAASSDHRGQPKIRETAEAAQLLFLLHVYQPGQQTGSSFIQCLAHNSLEEEIIYTVEVLLRFWQVS